MADDSREKDRLRALIRDHLQKVPASVLNGDIKTVREWKEVVAEAKKAVEKPKTTAAVLAQHLNAVRRYE